MQKIDVKRPEQGVVSWYKVKGDKGCNDGDIEGQDVRYVPSLNTCDANSLNSL